MKAASIHELKQELSSVAPATVAALCLRLARYKKENKELLTYLLFEAHDEQAYIQSVQAEIQTQFRDINTSHVYFAKKSLRKILRFAGKHIKYTGSKQAEVAILIYFCTQLKTSGIPIQKSTALTSLYNQQIKKIKLALASLHEDLQHDFMKELEALD